VRYANRSAWQLAERYKRVVRGFRNFEFFRAVANLRSANLEFALPSL
jgi:hypothetical protein